MKLDPFLQHRMRTDDQVRSAIGNVCQGLARSANRLLAAQQHRLQAELLQPVMKLQEVLLAGFRWGHHRHLGIVFDGQQGRHQGDDGLAAATSPCTRRFIGWGASGRADFAEYPRWLR